MLGVVVCSPHNAEKRDAQNQSSQELRGEFCDKGSPAERGLTNVPGEGVTHTLWLGRSHAWGISTMCEQSLYHGGASPGLKGDVVGETNQMVFRLR